MNKLSSLVTGLTSIVKEQARTVVHYGHTSTLAERPCHDDLYVVSFPKSGTTWLNFLMANIHLHMSGIQRNVTFFNIHQLIPDIHISRHARHLPLTFPGFRVIKSHASHNPYYKNVIYVVRDPRDTLISYFYFLVGLDEFSGNMSQLIHSPAVGIQAWAEHVRSWLTAHPSVRIIYVRYEDLKTNPEGTLKMVYGLLGYELDDSVLRSAIVNSSFDRMKALEQSYGYGGRDVAKKLKFMRSGKVGGWMDEMSEADLAFVRRAAGNMMERFNYG